MTSRQILRVESWKETLLTNYKVLHEGDCIGADAQMVDLFRDHLHIVSHPPINERYRAFAYADEVRKPEEYLDRNQTIVNESFLIVATPRQYQYVPRSGTWATINYAVKSNKRVMIIWPDGTYERG